MVRNVLLLFGFLLSIQITVAQEVHKRIKIPSTSPSTIQKLNESYIDLRCGAHFDENSIQLELSTSELERLEAKGVPYTVLIEDLTSFYSQRATQNIDLARQRIAEEKAKKKTKTKSSTKINTTRSSISSVTLDNYIQYEGCDEVDWEVPDGFNLNPNSSPNSFGGLLTVDLILQELDDMRSQYGNLISVKMDASPGGEQTYGNTYGDASDDFDPQTVYYVRISDNPDIDEDEPEVLYTSMIHAREVSSVMGLLYYMWYVLENYDTDPAIKNLVDSNEMYFIPIVNPDGLKWNQVIAPNGGGFQRKNLRVRSGESQSTGTGNIARGVDLNRNFDYLFGSAGDPFGSSDTATDDDYRGPNAFSEPESRILRDFVLSRNIETALMHHSFSNAAPHPYGGVPTMISNREDEMHKWHEDMTKFNRYVYGAQVFSAANGVADDWMVGGVLDGNNSVGSGENILASTPESGHSSEGGFWPDPLNIVPIAKKQMRINLMTAYYAGQYARLHDLTQNDITGLTSDLQFGIERLGQTPGDFTVTVTPVSNNIESITSPGTQSGLAVLQQVNVAAQLQLKSTIQPLETIEYNVTLSNGNGAVFYDVNYSKTYQPAILFADNPDVNGLDNWNVTGGQWITSTTNPYSGTTAIKSGATTPYDDDINSTLTTANPVDLSNSSDVKVQFYTRWDVERNFDFVEIQGSTDGTTWQTLCGKFNKPEAQNNDNDSHTGKFGNHSFQSNNSSGRVYDGDQMGKWVMEEIRIDNTNNNFLLSSTGAYFRFRFFTDSSARPENFSTDYSGFFIDDFKITGTPLPCVVSIPTNTAADIITNTAATISWDNIASASYDVRYKLATATQWIDIFNISETTIDFMNLVPASNYEVQVRSKCSDTPSNYAASYFFTTAAPVACTGAEETSFPYAENLDADINLSGWTQPTGDSGNWSQISGETPSSGTGPLAGFNNGGQYLYIEASDPSIGGVGNNATVYLESPCFNLTGFESPNFTFYYHMFGGNIGSLSLEISINNGSTWTNLTTISGQQQTATDTNWLPETIDLSFYNNSVIKLRFIGITGNDFDGDIAIDQLSLNASAINTCVSTKTWDGANWTPTGAPTGIDNVIINGDYNTFDHGNLTACTLTVTAGNALTVSPDTFVLVEDDITINGSLLITHTANVVQVQPSAIVTNNGVINVNITTPEISSRGFILQGSPMTSETTDVYLNNGVNDGWKLLNYNAVNFIPNSGVTTSQGTNFADDNGDHYDDYTGILNPGEGYLVRPQSNIQDNSVGTYNYTFETGTLNNGDVVFTAFNNGSTVNPNGTPQIISNPYPGAISGDQFLTENTNITALYFWEHLSLPSASFPGALSVNFSMDDISIYNGIMGLPAANDTGISTEPNGVIATSQGFGVRTTGNQGTQENITFTNTMRLTTGNTTLRNSIETQTLLLEMRSDTYETGSFTGIAFSEQGTQGHDEGYDTNRLATTVSLFSQYDEATGQLGIQTREAFNTAISIPIGIESQIEQETSFTISLKKLAGTYLENTPVYLIDNLTGSKTVLNNTNYTFTVNEGVYLNRFTLRFGDLLSINDIEALQVLVFPNPTSGKLLVESPVTIQNINVFDVQGRGILAQKKINEKTIAIDLSGVTAGVYLVEIMTNSGNITKHIIKK